MLDWLNLGNKNYPEFWRSYLSNFDKKSERIVVLKIHTSGTDSEKDAIVSLAAIAISNDALAVNDSFESIIAHRKLNIDDLNHDQYLEISLKEKVTEQVAMESFIEYLKNSTIVGHRIDLEIEFINHALSNLGCGKLKNEALDLEVMYRKWKDFSDNKYFNINDTSRF